MKTTVIGLKDGKYTAGTAMRIRKIRSLGARVQLAKTGRVTVTTSTGERRVYALEMAPGFQDFTDQECVAANSPLSQALRDLEEPS